LRYEYILPITYYLLYALPYVYKKHLLNWNGFPQLMAVN
jgi:hypothetical protein